MNDGRRLGVEITKPPFALLLKGKRIRSRYFCLVYQGVILLYEVGKISLTRQNTA